MNENNTNTILRKLQKTRDVFFNSFVWIIIIFLWIITSIVNPVFYSPINIQNIFYHSVILGLLVLAESICLITGHFDLSIESILVFSGMFGAWLISESAVASGLILNPILGILLTIVMGGLIGAINGLLIAYVGVNPFITTLAMSIIFAGLSVFITRGQPMYPLNDMYNFLGRGKVFEFPVAIIFIIIVFIIFWIMLTYTTFGRKLYIVGGNKFAAKASGINVKLIVFSAYVISGVLCGFGGWLLAGRLNAAAPTMSSGLLLFAFAAAVIGGVSLSGGEGRVIGIFGGVLLLSSISNLMNLAGIDVYLIKVATGVIILVAMLIDTLKKGKIASIV